LAAKKAERKKLPPQLVLGQIPVADSLKLLTPPLAGIGAELLNARPLEFAYALRNGRIIFFVDHGSPFC